MFSDQRTHSFLLCCCITYAKNMTFHTNIGDEPLTNYERSFSCLNKENSAHDSATVDPLSLHGMSYSCHTGLYDLAYTH